MHLITYFILGIAVATPVHGGVVQNVVHFFADNIFGIPPFLKRQEWKFDPHVSSRRASEYQAKHGIRSEKLIEELGLGIDGRQEERRVQQAVRDQGVPVQYFHFQVEQVNGGPRAPAQPEHLHPSAEPSSVPYVPQNNVPYHY